MKKILLATLIALCGVSFSFGKGGTACDECTKWKKAECIEEQNCANAADKKKCEDDCGNSARNWCC